jgi:hypothetical protein
MLVNKILIDLRNWVEKLGSLSPSNQENTREDKVEIDVTKISFVHVKWIELPQDQVNEGVCLLNLQFI